MIRIFMIMMIMPKMEKDPIYIHEWVVASVIMTDNGYKVGPPFDSVQLANITPMTMVYGTYNYSFHGVFVHQHSHHNGGPHIGFSTVRNAIPEGLSPWSGSKTKPGSTHGLSKIGRDHIPSSYRGKTWKNPGSSQEKTISTVSQNHERNPV